MREKKKRPTTVEITIIKGLKVTVTPRVWENLKSLYIITHETQKYC